MNGLSFFSRMQIAEAGWHAFAGNAWFLFFFGLSLAFLFLSKQPKKSELDKMDAIDELDEMDQRNDLEQPASNSLLRSALLQYAFGAALCCIIPITAALLNLYFTHFYTYPWIWSLVPVLPVTAWGATRFFSKTRKKGRLLLPFCFAFLLLLCSYVGYLKAEERILNQKQLKTSTEVLAFANLNAETDCIYGPEELMLAARMMEKPVKVLYGRDMWEPELDAYCNEDYSQTLVDLHDYLIHLKYYDDFSTADIPWITTAFSEGATHIFLPYSSREDYESTLSEVALMLDLQVTMIVASDDQHNACYYVLTK